MYKMIEHVDELEQRYFRERLDTDAQNGRTPSIERSDRLQWLRGSGYRIRERLQDLVDEYDEHGRACTTIMDGMNLATPMVTKL